MTRTALHDGWTVRPATGRVPGGVPAAAGPVP